MPIRDIAVVWAEPATDPRESFQSRDPYPTLRQAIEAAQSAQQQAQHPGRVAWLRAGTGFGSEIVDGAGIEMLRVAFNEGVAHGTPI